MAAVRGAEPSVWRRAADRRSAVDGWARPTEPRVRPAGVVVSAPSFEHGTRVWQRAEQGLIEQLVAQSANKGLGKSVLHGLARGDVVPGDLMIVRPLQSFLPLLLSEDWPLPFCQGPL